MKEPHIEGLATHDDPESCAAIRKEGGEALTGVRVGWVLSRAISQSRVPTLLCCAEGNTDRSARASSGTTLAVGDPTHARNLLAREP